MTAAGAAGTATPARPSRRLLAGHLPAHAVMLAAMAVSMRPGATAVDHLAAIVLLVVTSAVLAPFARSRPRLGGAIVDLWAMIAILLAAVWAAPASGPAAHHAASAPAAVADAAILAGWFIVRLPRVRAVAEGAFATLSGASLVAMALLHAAS
jgi:hypothetical protein